MSDLKRWVDALLIHREIDIESSQEIISSIHKQQSKRRRPPQSKVPLAVVKRFAPRRTIKIRPFDLLHRLGLVLTPIIPNLTDLCSHWAYMRYLWAFEPPSGTSIEPLRLSREALSIDFHQKGLMSDEIGVGMAALIMAEYFNAPGFADVSVAAKTQTLPVQLTESASPDYLFWNATRSKYYVVECKGTRCAKNVVLAQLCRGLEQLPSLRFTDGRQPPIALVVATKLTGTGTEVFIVDPPLRHGDNPRHDDDLEDEEDDLEDEDDDDDDDDDDDGPTGGRQSIGLVFDLKRLAYAGDDQTIQDVVMQKWPRLADIRLVRPRQMVSRINDSGEFVGVEYSLPFSLGTQINVFQGLERGLLNTIRKNFRKMLTAREDSAASGWPLVLDHDRQSDPDVTETNGSVKLSGVSLDGTILEIHLQEAPSSQSPID